MAPLSSILGVLPIVLGIVKPALGAAIANTNTTQPACRSFPGDASWPSIADWESFNQTVGGRLIATVPLATPCHDSSFGPYNEEECAEVQSNWGFPELHFGTSSSVMAPYFANRSCDAFNERSDQCIYGTFVRYAVNASCADDYKQTIKFAQDNNVRLVIRNTAHDFFGKSTGAGGLAIWTHHLKDIEIKDYKESHYQGKAIHIGAGVQSFEAQQVAHDAGYVAVTGNCPTVGLAGGYTQAGGHSPLSSKYGLAADQVVEWEVVTGEGELVTATPSNEHSDLYWALSGGGGGTYGVVLSMTAKLHVDMPVTSANLTFSPANVSEAAFYDAVQTYFLSLNDIADAGAVSVWVLANSSFSVTPTTGPGLTKDEMDALFAPTLAKLAEHAIPYTYHSETFADYVTANDAMNPQGNNTEISLGGRLLPRSLLASAEASEAFVAAAKAVVRYPQNIIDGITLNVGTQERSENAAHPKWRDAILNAVVGVAWDRDDWEANMQGLELITNELQPRLDSLAEGYGSYMNEADFNHPEWKEAFYGVNYEKLLAIKNKYDPKQTFYARTAVGSDLWVEESDGRLCRAA